MQTPDNYERNLGPLIRDPSKKTAGCAKAERLFGYRPTRGWRDHLDSDGRGRNV